MKPKQKIETLFLHIVARFALAIPHIQYTQTLLSRYISQTIL